MVFACIPHVTENFESSLLGGIDPSKTMAVTLDVGTDNESLLDDHLYVVSIRPAFWKCSTLKRLQGWPNRRVRGEAYDRFVDKYVKSADTGR